jgi:hypothetical protein
METITCPTCKFDHRFPPGERPPPWCPRCGGDLRVPVAAPRPVAPVAARAPADAPPEVELTHAESDRPTSDLAPLVTREQLLSGRTFQRAYQDMDGGRVETPVFVWLFAAACLALPVITLGGALPLLFGLGGALACVRVGTSRTEDTFGKLCYCGGVTVLCWVGCFGLTVWLAGLVAGR